MSEKSKWAIRQMRCPEEKGETELLIEWKVQKGKKVLHGISCAHPQLADYGGVDCEWLCLKRVSPKKG